MKRFEQKLRFAGLLFLAVAMLSFTVVAFGQGSPGYGTTNVARGKPVTPLTNTVRGTPAGVTDGSLSNTWYSYQCSGWAPCINQFKIDLGAEYNIGKINAWPLQTGYYTLYSSTDGVNWTARHQHNWITSSGLYVASHSAPITLYPNGAYSARYFKWEGAANWNQYVGMYEFEVYEWLSSAPPAPDLSSLTNLALGKTAQNYSTLTSVAGHSPSLLTDGDTNTYWQGNSAYDQCQYIYQAQCPLGTWYATYGGAYIDLGSPQPIQAVRLKFPAGVPGAQTYYVTLADDTTSTLPFKGWQMWGDPAMIASNPPVTSSETRTFTWPAPVSARYVYVVTENLVTRAPLLPAVAEMEVFGELPDPTPTPTATPTPTPTIEPTTTTINCPMSVVYDGSALMPCSATVTGANDFSQTLPVSYGNNVNAGTATADAYFAGNENNAPSTAAQVTFEITPASSMTVVTCGPGPFVYNGSAQTPCSVSVTGAGGLNLTPAPVYANNINAGMAAASYTFAGDPNHMGSSDAKNFTITKATTTTVVMFEPGPYFFRGTAFAATANVMGAGGLNEVIGVQYTGNCTYVTMPLGCTATATYPENANYFGSNDTKSITIVSGCTQFIGFKAPISGAVENGNGGSPISPVRSFKLGSTIPVKFSAMCFGAPLTTGIHTLQAQKWSSATSVLSDPIDATPTDAATTGNQFRLTDTEWHYNLSTRNTPGFTTGTWLLKATLYDGSSYTVWIEIK